jgi:hypothetical protein
MQREGWVASAKQGHIACEFMLQKGQDQFLAPPWSSYDLLQLFASAKIPSQTVKKKKKKSNGQNISVALSAIFLLFLS